MVKLDYSFEWMKVRHDFFVAKIEWGSGSCPLLLTFSAGLSTGSDSLNVMSVYNLIFYHYFSLGKLILSCLALDLQLTSNDVGKSAFISLHVWYFLFLQFLAWI